MCCRKAEELLGEDQCFGCVKDVADELAAAVARYRRVYDLRGGDDIAIGRAWDAMRVGLYRYVEITTREES